MNRRISFLLIVLISLPAALISYRVIYLNYPLLPSVQQRVWHLSTEVHLSDDKEGEYLTIGLPSDKHGLTVLEEKITSGNLSFRLFTESTNRFGIWSVTADNKGSVVLYQSTVVIKRQGMVAPADQFGQYLKGTGKREQHVAQKLVSRITGLPLSEQLKAVDAIIAAAQSFSHQGPEIASDLNAWSAIQKEAGVVKARLILLRAAGLNAYAMSGLKLKEGVTSETVDWVEIWSGEKWHKWQPGTGLVSPGEFLPLIQGTLPVVSTSKGEISDIRWTLARNIISQWDLQYERIGRSDKLLDRWSLFRLPQEYQGTLRILILVPLGALIVCILRNVIGFPTFGIFMPVLMALAFRNTGLGYGLIIFIWVLLLGYAARSFLEKMRLLLVPRLSVILTLVIGCFVIIALIGSKMELKAFMAIGLLPFVILTMAIERFFIIIEEEGIGKGLSTALGSAAVATIAYEIIQFEPLQITFFVYPELLLVVMAAEVLLGRYTGYRLSEFVRFRKMKGS